MQEPVAWTLDGWKPITQVAIGLDDWGFVQGAVAVDRLRTFRHRAGDAAPHIDRFLASCRYLGIEPPQTLAWQEIIDECVARNRAAFNGRDFGIVLLATPGRAIDASTPTLIVQPIAIPWNELQLRYTRGQPLTLAKPRNVPAACWSPNIKTRARLQYYLADMAARRPASPEPHAESNQARSNQVAGRDAAPGAVLLDLAGNLTETSQANLLVIQGGDVLSPPADTILYGLSLQRTLRLLKSAGYAVRHEPIAPDVAMSADEILLCGTTGCVWPAASLEERQFESPSTAPAFQLAQQLWTRELGYDFTLDWPPAA